MIILQYYSSDNNNIHVIITIISVSNDITFIHDCSCKKEYHIFSDVWCCGGMRRSAGASRHQ